VRVIEFNVGVLRVQKYSKGGKENCGETVTFAVAVSIKDALLI
jgi:hypothetical protein